MRERSKQRLSQHRRSPCAQEKSPSCSEILKQKSEQMKVCKKDEELARFNAQLKDTNKQLKKQQKQLVKLLQEKDKLISVIEDDQARKLVCCVVLALGHRYLTNQAKVEFVKKMKVMAYCMALFARRNLQEQARQNRD